MSVRFVRCQGEAANSRSVDAVGKAPPDDAACLRSNMIREQMILCATRTSTKTNLLCGAYEEGGAISRGSERCRSLFTSDNRRARIGASDETGCAV